MTLQESMDKHWRAVNKVAKRLNVSSRDVHMCWSKLKTALINRDDVEVMKIINEKRKTKDVFKSRTDLFATLGEPGLKDQKLNDLMDFDKDIFTMAKILEVDRDRVAAKLSMLEAFKEGILAGNQSAIEAGQSICNNSMSVNFVDKPSALSQKTLDMVSEMEDRRYLEAQINELKEPRLKAMVRRQLANVDKEEANKAFNCANWLVNTLGSVDAAQKALDAVKVMRG